MRWQPQTPHARERCGPINRLPRTPKESFFVTKWRSYRTPDKGLALPYSHRKVGPPKEEPQDTGLRRRPTPWDRDFVEDKLRKIQNFIKDQLRKMQDFIEDKLHKKQDFIEDNNSQDTGLRKKMELSHPGQDSCSVVFSWRTQTIRISISKLTPLGLRLVV